MMIGLAIFIAPTLVTQVLIGVGAAASATGLVFAGMRQTQWVLGGNLFVAAALLVAMVFGLRALANGGVPAGVGAPPRTKSELAPAAGEGGAYREGPSLVTTSPLFKRNLAMVLGGVAVLVPAFKWLVENRQIARLVLYSTGTVALAYIVFEMTRVTRRERERLGAILRDGLLLDALLGVLRAGRELDQQLHRPQRRPRERRPGGHRRRRGAHREPGAQPGAARIPPERARVHHRPARRRPRRRAERSPA